MKKPHYELLDCGHQNNLLLTYPDKSKNKSGVCPKGCNNPKILETVDIDTELSSIEITEEP